MKDCMLLVIFKLIFLKLIISNLKKKLLILRGKLFLRFFRFFKVVYVVKLYDDICLVIWISLFICYMIVFCRYFVIIKVYDNGISKDYGGNEIKLVGFDKIFLKVVIIVFFVFILVLCGIIFYIEWKRRRGSDFIWNFILVF